MRAKDPFTANLRSCNPVITGNRTTTNGVTTTPSMRVTDAAAL
jgi:hypothetical protein